MYMYPVVFPCRRQQPQCHGLFLDVRVPIEDVAPRQMLLVVEQGVAEVPTRKGVKFIRNLPTKLSELRYIRHEKERTRPR